MRLQRLILAMAARSWREPAVCRWLVVGLALLTLTSGQAQTPGVALTRVYTFPGSQGEFSGFLVGRDGNFYGATGDVILHTGSVFEVTPGGTLTTLHQFSGAEGNPTSLRQGADGNCYGETSLPGNVFTVFRLTPNGTLAALHTFADGTRPHSLALATDGNLYGAASPAEPDPTQKETDTLFRLTPGGAFTRFSPFGDSNTVIVSLLQGVDGSLYGAAVQPDALAGNGPHILGQLFRFAVADGTITPLTRLHKINGFPTENLLQDATGNFYNLGSVPPMTFGTTVVDTLTLTRTTPTGQQTVSTVGGGNARGVALGQDGNFYVVSTITFEEGGSTGAISVVSPHGTEALVYSFSGNSSTDPATPMLPLSSLVRSTDGSLYGLAASAHDTFIYRLDVIVPTVKLSASVPDVIAGSGSRGKFLLTLSAPWPYDLTVAYTVAGTAVPGTDYQALSGMVAIPAGQTNAIIRVKPGQTPAYVDKKTVKLALTPGAGYTVGAPAAAKVKILAP